MEKLKVKIEVNYDMTENAEKLAVIKLYLPVVDYESSYKYRVHPAFYAVQFGKGYVFEYETGSFVFSPERPKIFDGFDECKGVVEDADGRWKCFTKKIVYTGLIDWSFLKNEVKNIVDQAKVALECLKREYDERTINKPENEVLVIEF